MEALFENPSLGYDWTSRLSVFVSITETAPWREIFSCSGTQVTGALSVLLPFHPQFSFDTGGRSGHRETIKPPASG